MLDKQRQNFNRFFFLQLSKAAPELARMAEIFTIDADSMPVYVEYFDITLIPATVFFYNGQHIKVDYGYVKVWHIHIFL